MHVNSRETGKRLLPRVGSQISDFDDDDGNGNGFSWRSLSHSQEHILKKKTTQQLCSTDL